MSIPDSNPNSPAWSIFRDELGQLQRRTDVAFAWLMAAQWLCAIMCALVLSPRTWQGAESAPHNHLYAALFLGGLLTIYPCWRVIRNQRGLTTHLVLAVAQMGYSALLIHLMAGRIEAHFHVFGSLAFLAIYRDTRVFIPAVAVTTIDHLARGILWPESVYGIITPTAWRTVEHALWVLFEVLFLAWGSCS